MTLDQEPSVENQSNSEEVTALIKKHYDLDISLSDQNAFFDGDELIYNGHIFKFHRNNKNKLIVITFNGEPVEWAVSCGKITVTINDRSIKNVVFDQDGNIQLCTIKEARDPRYDPETTNPIITKTLIYTGEFKYSQSVSFYHLSDTNSQTKREECIMLVDGEVQEFSIAGENVKLCIEEDRKTGKEKVLLEFHGEYFKVDFNERGGIISKYEIEGISYLGNNVSQLSGDDILVELLDIVTGKKLEGYRLFNNGQYVPLDEDITCIHNIHSDRTLDITYKNGSPRLERVRLQEGKGKLSKTEFDGDTCIIGEKTEIGNNKFAKLYSTETGEYKGTKVIFGWTYRDVLFQGEVYDPINENIDFKINDIDHNGNIVLYRYKGVDHVIEEIHKDGETTVYHIISLENLCVKEVVSCQGQGIVYYSSHGDNDFKYYQSDDGMSLTEIDITYDGDICYLNGEETTDFELATRLSNIGAGEKVESVILDNKEFRDITVDGEKVEIGRYGDILFQGQRLEGIEISSDGKIQLHTFGEEKYIAHHKSFTHNNLTIKRFINIRDPDESIWKVVYNGEYRDITLNGVATAITYHRSSFADGGYISLALGERGQHICIDINSNGEIVTQQMGGKTCYFIKKDDGKGTSVMYDSQTYHKIGDCINVDGKYCEVRLNGDIVKIRSYVNDELVIEVNSVQGIPDGKYEHVKLDIETGGVIIEQVLFHTADGEKRFAKIGDSYFFQHDKGLSKVPSDYNLLTSLHQAFINNSIEEILKI